MLQRLIRSSLEHRWLVLGAALALLVLGAFRIQDMPVDVLPDLSAPTVTVVTEAPGMAPEEVELLVTFAVESVLNGAPDLRRLRSVSAAGISVVWVEFDWGSDVYRTRQIVSERLARLELPDAVDAPQLGPISSIMGEITFIALTTDPDLPDPATGRPLDERQLRRLSEVVLQRQLLAIPGIAQVVPIGGERRQIEIEVDPQTLRQRHLSLDQVVTAARQAGHTSAAGFHTEGDTEYLVRTRSRITSIDHLAQTLVRSSASVDDASDSTHGQAIRLGEVATIREAAEPRRGMAGFRGRPAVVLSVQKQLGANTLQVTRAIDGVLADIAPSLPAGARIETDSFRQATFIERAIHNVRTALRDGAILVVVVLFVFLGNLRTTLISALAIPLSLVAGILVVSAFGGSLDTMTLGGLTIAIGALVDDAIIDVENVFRRLREQRRRPEGERIKAIDIVFRASSEVRSAIFFATAILILVLLPLLVLPGVEGRLLRPLALAYAAALAASLLVSVTVTPVLCLLLLRGKLLDREDPWLMRRLHHLYAPSLERAMAHPRWVVATALALLAAALALLPGFGRSFLPPFNEGSFTLGLTAPPGISLEESDALGRRAEELLLALDGVRATSRRTGRAERDEHVQGVNRSELEVVLEPDTHRSKDEMAAALRQALAPLPVVTEVGQPISHRIDHMISGSRTNLAVKVFGPDPTLLRQLSQQVEAVLRDVPGIVDLSNQEQDSVPQLTIDLDRARLTRYGLTTAELGTTLEALFQGTPAGQLTEDGLVTSVVVRYPEGLRHHRDQLARLPIITPGGEVLRLDAVADLRFDLGPSLVRRENVERVAMVTANVTGADLAGRVELARRAVAERVELPQGYRITFGGQFEEAERSLHQLALLSGVIVVAMVLLLVMAFGRFRHALIVLANLPLALIGGIAAVALGEGVLSVATLVGFVTLFGIATRNGVLLVSHYRQLMTEGLHRLDAVRQGSRERLAPILMTALTAGLALIPLVLAGGEPGNEIQSPMAEVILGGLLTSTFLNLVVVPALFARWGD